MKVVNVQMDGSSVFKEYAKGFKQITSDTLLKPDEHSSYPSRLRGDKWVRECLKPQLDSGVPVEVAFLFEVARGSMVYGIFFLPLAALATEQGSRVLEAGARHRCKQLGLLKKKSAKTSAFPDSPFVDVVAALQKASGIPKACYEADSQSRFPLHQVWPHHPTFRAPNMHRGSVNGRPGSRRCICFRRVLDVRTLPGLVESPVRCTIARLFRAPVGKRNESYGQFP